MVSDGIAMIQRDYTVLKKDENGHDLPESKKGQY